PGIRCGRARGRMDGGDRRLHDDLHGLVQPHAVEHAPRGDRGEARRADRGDGQERPRPVTRDIQPPLPAISLGPRRGAGDRRGPQAHARRPRAAPRRFDCRAPGNRQAPAAAVPARSYSREQGRGQAREDALDQSRELLRGRNPHVGYHQPRREEGDQELPAGQWLTGKGEGEKHMAETTMGSAGARPTLFLRNVTGLVKAWSTFDAFVYSFWSVNLITLGLYGMSYVYSVPDGQ